MTKKEIVTIAGKPGSGKSSTSKSLAYTLGYEHFSSGDLFRSIGKERGIDVFETNLLAETEREIDELVDTKLREIESHKDKLVIDSRMAWHWMPNSFKVYLDLDLITAAERIMSHQDRHRYEAESIPNTVTAYANRLQERLDSETKRYMNLYKVNPYNHKNYDLIVDTSTKTIKEVQKIILQAYKKWL